MQIIPYDFSQPSRLETSKQRSKWTPKRNADFCISNQVWSAMDAFIQAPESLSPESWLPEPWPPEVWSPEARGGDAKDIKERIWLNLSLSLGALLFNLKKSILEDLQPAQMCALHAIIEKALGPPGQSKASTRSLRIGVLTSHAIVNELVHAGLEPLRATALLIAFGPYRRKHYRTLTEDSKDYWVEQLKDLNTSFNRNVKSKNICLAKLLAEMLSRLGISLRLEDVHTNLGYKFTCITCFPGHTAKASDRLCLDLAVKRPTLLLGGPLYELLHNITIHFESSCQNLNLDEQGVLLTQAGVKRRNDSCDSFDSYCFSATMFAQNGMLDEFGQALNKACTFVDGILRDEHPRALTCFFEVFVHLIQSGHPQITSEILQYVGSTCVVRGRHHLGRICWLLKRVDRQSLDQAMAIAWECASDIFNRMLGRCSSLAVSVRLDYIKRVHGFTHHIEEERLLRELFKQLDCTLHPSIPRVLLNLAHNMNKQGRYDDARCLALRVCELIEEHKEYADKTVERIESQKVIAKSHYAEGSIVEAEFAQRCAISMVEENWGQQHAWVVEFMNVLEAWLRNWGKETEASTVRSGITELIDKNQWRQVAV